MQSDLELGAARPGFLTRRLADVDVSGLALKILRIGLFYLALLALWQLVIELHIWKPYLIPSPSAVWESFRHYVDNGLLWRAIKASMQHLVVGYVLSIFVGTVIGMSCGANKYADETMGSLVLGLQSMPSVAWVPLGLVWFGFGAKAIVFVTFLGSFSAIAISARSAIMSIPPLYRRASLTMGANQFERIRYVLLPAMVPGMAQGLKLGWSFAWRSLMAAELVNQGAISLGGLLETGRGVNDMSLVVMVMFVIIAIGLTVDRLLFARLEGWVQERWGLQAA
jgi:NitT/TauT family transport system permease protein